MADKDKTEAFGDTNTQSLQEIWNAPPMRALRLDMINGRPNEICNKCYKFDEAGAPSLRAKSLRFYNKHVQKVRDTAADGSAGAVNMPYLDIRFNNLCNLKCRPCYLDASTSWYRDHVKLYGDPGYGPLMQVRENMISFWEELEPLLDSVEEVSFAGGESLLQEEHYKILDHWIAREKFDVQMIYYTNFTVTEYKGRSIFDLWKKFKNVVVIASLDGSYERGEYLRKNLKWNQIVENRKKMQAICPQVMFQISPTITNYNILHFPDFYSEWVELGLINPYAVAVNLLHSPPWMSSQVLPKEIKNKVREKYQVLMDRAQTPGEKAAADAIFASIVRHMDEVDGEPLLQTWFNSTVRLDRIRGEDVFAIFPELLPLKQGLAAPELSL